MSCTAELLAISQISPGQTYSPVYRTAVIHGTWSAAFWRRYYRESRYTVVYSLENLFKEALLDYTNYPLIEKALQGCRNLQITYKDDIQLIEKIDQIISNTESTILNNQPKPIEENTAQIPVSSKPDDIQENIPDHEVIEIETIPSSYNDLDILTIIINRILDELDSIHATLDEILNNICSGAGNLAAEIKELLDKFPNSKIN